MGKKRSNNAGNNSDRKKYKVAAGIIDPQTAGIYATCNRHQEKKCQNELKILFEEKLQEYYKDELNQEADDNVEEEEGKELSIEESIKRELEGLQPKKKDTTKKAPLQFIDLGCECVVFCKTRAPIDPATFVERICQESYESKMKNTRFTQKLTPIEYSVSGTIEEVEKLAKRVLKPHFHKEEGQQPHTFAIKVTTRNFNTITKGDIIQKVAECMGREHGHKVDLKNYEKLVLVECFKNNIGMSVVNNYEKYQRFNLQQIFEKQLKYETDTLSRTQGAKEKILVEENKEELPVEDSKGPEDLPESTMA